MPALSGLNSEQTRAVQAVDRHLLVVAGAGSGKTRVLTHKIAYLVEECGYRASEIAAMTFSNKAAAEILERARRLLPTYEQPRWIGTFHSLCLRLLKDFAPEAGLPPQFSIYDEADQLSVLRRALQTLNLDPKQYPAKNIRWHIDRAKNESSYLMKHLSGRGELSDQALQVAELYEKTLLANHALDFGDLLIRTVRLLREKPEVAESLRKRWRYLLIDEYQDTNRIQKELVKEFAGTTGLVCAVGDEDQSIYGWRGARVENILEFEDDFPGAELVKLEQNYRSTQQILTVANSVISHNIGRRGKKLWTENGAGDLVTFMLADDDHGEAAFVMDEVEARLRKGIVTPREVSIFYRTHVQSRLLEEECRRRNRPYRVFGGIRFYDRAEVKDIFAFLRLALNPSDNVSFLRIVNTPSRGIGGKAIEQLTAVAQQRDLSLFYAIPYFGDSSKAAKSLAHFYDWMSRLIVDAPTFSPEVASEMALKESGYLKALETEGTIESDSKLENIQELLRSMQEFSEGSEGGLPAYMDRISLVADMDRYDVNAETITLMTVHNAKGLEFDAVYVVGMEEGIFPHQRSLEEGDPEQVEEERRLCYVAMTRARKWLTLSAAVRRRLYQSTQFNPVSRFIGEIPNTLLNDIRPKETGSWNQPPQRSYKPRGEYDEYKQESYEEDVYTAPDWKKRLLAKIPTGDPYNPGAQVIHPSFGRGTIRKREGESDNLKLTIQFERVGYKKILLNFATLELAERSS